MHRQSHAPQVVIVSRSTRVGHLAAVVAGAVLLAAPAAVDAQSRGHANGWSVTPFLGVAFAGNLENAPATGGVAAGFAARGIGVEGEISRLRAEQGFPTRFETTVWSFGINGLWHLDTDRAFTPYALAGIAWQRASADLEDVPGGPFPFDDAVTEVSFNGGVGLKAMLTDRAGLRVDLRYVNGRELAPDFWRVSAGLNWLFGR